MMTKKIYKKLFLFSFLTALSPLFAEISESDSITEPSGISLSPEYAEIPDLTESVQNGRFHFIFDEGLSLLQVTRLQKESSTSNFVWQDAMAGIYSSIQTRNLNFWHDLYFRYQILYPFHHQFNGMEMMTKQTLLYAADFFFGLPFRYEGLKYIRFTFTPGLHGMYQLSDEYHLGYFGFGGLVGAEFPISSRWTGLLDGGATYDYANIGSNKVMQPFDMSWSWQCSMGVRYSRKNINKYSYVSR